MAQEAGWYAHPSRPGKEQYWDGKHWQHGAIRAAQPDWRPDADNPATQRLYLDGRPTSTTRGDIAATNTTGAVESRPQGTRQAKSASGLRTAGGFAYAVALLGGLASLIIGIALIAHKAPANCSALYGSVECLGTAPPRV